MMPKYLLAMVGDDDAYRALDDDESKRIYAGHEAFAASLAEAGVALSSAAELEPPGTARTVHPNGQISDGPCAPGPEQLGGFYVIDVPDIDAAVEWAGRIPLLPTDKIEVRKTT